MKKYILVFGLIVSLILFVSIESFAQCAMCRATVENNISSGGNIGAGLNAGILYLAAMPYLAFVAIVYFFFKASKKYGRNHKVAGYRRS